MLLSGCHVEMKNSTTATNRGWGDAEDFDDEENGLIFPPSQSCSHCYNERLDGACISNPWYWGQCTNPAGTVYCRAGGPGGHYPVMTCQAQTVTPTSVPTPEPTTSAPTPAPTSSPTTAPTRKPIILGRPHVWERDAEVYQSFSVKSSKESGTSGRILHLIDDNWTDCENLVRTGDQTDMPNAASKYVVGEDMSTWGCSCIGSDVEVWYDPETEKTYIVEDVENMCEPPTNKVVGAEVATCDTPITSVSSLPYMPASAKIAWYAMKGMDMAIDNIPDDGCLDFGTMVKGTIDDLSDFLGGQETQGLGVLKELALPFLQFVFTCIGRECWNKAGTPGIAEHVNNYNFCLGEYSGEDLLGKKNMQGDSLWRDGCAFPPYVNDVKYKIVSAMIPTVILNALALCAELDITQPGNDIVYFCVAYTNCEELLPTFALQISGSLASCLLKSPVVSFASGGLSTALGQAVKFALKDIGFGISLTGKFEQNFTVFDGEMREVELKGNFYSYIKLTTTGLIPEWMAKYVGMAFDLYVMIQINDGSITDTMQDLWHHADPVEFVKSLSRVSLAGQGSIDLKIKLDELLLNTLPPLGLGDLSDVNLLLSTMTLGQGKVLPGIYLYAETGSDFLKNIMKFMTDNFPTALDMLNVGDAISAAFNTATEKLGKLDYALYLNTDHLGFLFTFPPIPPISFFGSGKLSCKVKLSTGEITCAGGYEFPKWLTLLWDGVKLTTGVVGEAVYQAGHLIEGAWETAVDDAMDKAEKALGKKGRALVQTGAEFLRREIPGLNGVLLLAKWAEKIGPAFKKSPKFIQKTGELLKKGAEVVAKAAIDSTLETVVPGYGMAKTAVNICRNIEKAIPFGKWFR